MLNIKRIKSEHRILQLVKHDILTTELHKTKIVPYCAADTFEKLTITKQIVSVEDLPKKGDDTSCESKETHQIVTR